MKMSAIEADSRVWIDGAGALLRAQTDAGLAFEPGIARGAVREWLPVPAPMVPKARRATPAARSSLWLRPEGESIAEKTLMGLLATAGVIGIGYGFSWMIDLVQGWVGFSAGIAHLVH